MRGERTRQGLDPSNTLGSRRGGIVLALVAFAWSTCFVAVGGVTVASAPVQLLGLLSLVVAGIVMVRACDPLRGPFSRGTHVAVHLLLLAGFVAATSSVSEAPGVFTGGWGPVAIGFFTVAMSPYRPVKELVAAASLSALFIAFVSLVRPSDAGPPSLAAIILSVLPILAFAYGTARYTQVTIQAVERRQQQSEHYYAGLADELAHTIGRSVQRDRARILGREAAPFLRDILARATVTEADRTRARAIGGAVRGIIVAEADLSWVEVAALASPPAAGGAHTVHDPDGVVAGMDQRQRAALRSLLVAASDLSVSSPLTLEFTREGDRCEAAVRFDVLATTLSLQPALDPYLAVMTAAFSSFSIHSTRPTLIVRFSFDYD